MISDTSLTMWSRSVLFLAVLAASVCLARATLASPHLFAYVPEGRAASFFRAPADARVGSVYVIDTASKTVVATISLPGTAMARDVAFTPDGSAAYVTGGDSNMVFIIDTVTNTVTGTVNVHDAARIALTPDGAAAYVTTGNAVSVIDTATRTVSTTIPVDFVTRGVAAGPGGRQVYVQGTPPTGGFGYVSRLSGLVAVIDTASNTVVTETPVARDTSSMAVTPDGRSLYVGQPVGPMYPDPLAIIDTTTSRVTATVPAADSNDRFSAMAFTPDGAQLYLANVGRHAVSVVDPATTTVIKTFPIQGSGPFGVATSPDGAVAYVTDLESSGSERTTNGSVSVIDTATNTVTKTILRVGYNPTNIAVAALAPRCGNGVVDADEQCDDGNWVGGDGCAPNCTRESTRTLELDPSVSTVMFRAAAADYTGSVRGSLRIRTGARSVTGSIPVAVTADDVRLEPVPVMGVGCVCLRAVPDPDLAPGVAGHGEIGCGRADPVSNFPVLNVAYLTSQVHNSENVDPECFRGTREPPTGKHPGVCNGPRRFFFFDPGPAGSAVLEINLLMRIIPDDGTCAVDPSDPAKGADGRPCTDDDPEAGSGTPLAPLTTAGSQQDGAQAGVARLDNSVSSTFVTGASFECAALAADPTGGTAGVTLVSALPLLDTALGDVVFSTVFAAAPVRTPTPTLAATATGTPIAATPTTTPVSPACVGDCNGNGAVTVDELVVLVNMALGNTGLATCPVGDANADGQITIEEIVTAVKSTLDGCSAP